MSKTETPAKAEETEAQEQTAQSGVHGSILDHEVQAFLNSAEKDGLEKAFQRHGFALFHSLPPEDRILFEQEMGVGEKDAPRLYNLGVAYAAKEKYDEAIACWRSALKKDASLSEALCNIAVAYERLGNTNAARDNYKRYAQTLEAPEDIEQLQEHLAQLGS